MTTIKLETKKYKNEMNCLRVCVCARADLKWFVSTV